MVCALPKGFSGRFSKTIHTIDDLSSTPQRLAPSRLDFDNSRAQVCEASGGERARQHLTEVQDPDSIQKTDSHHHFLLRSHGFRQTFPGPRPTW